uniref:Piwi domain-containing protein n=1 Tax=Oncorhynchus tshawytscha TaxID=74940 RepID=A0A8C8K0X3_ONCTS
MQPSLGHIIAKHFTTENNGSYWTGSGSPSLFTVCCLPFGLIKIHPTWLATPNVTFVWLDKTLVFSRLMRILGLKHAFYVPKSALTQAIWFPSSYSRLQVWPGYSMCRMHTGRSLYLQVDVSHKVFLQHGRLQVSKNYGITIKDMAQLILIHPPKKRSNQVITGMILLLPELFFMTGIPDKMRTDFRAMTVKSLCQQLSDEQHTHSLKQLLKNTNPEAQMELAHWGLEISQDILVVTGRILPLETVCLQSASFVTGADVSWSKEVVRDASISYIHMNCWAKFYLLFQPKVQLVVCIMTGNRDDLYCLYCAIKKLYCIQSPVPSQVDTATSPDNSLRSDAQKILLQMNCKLGGELWTVNIPLFSIIIFTGKVGLPSVCSLNIMLTRWYTRVTFQIPNEEVINGIRVCLLAALHKYYVVFSFVTLPRLSKYISLPRVYFFYLMAHHIQQGCGLPTHYISVYNTANHFSKMYWNWPWTIQVPVPYKYGLKLAYLSGQYFHSELAIQLTDKLYFLLGLSPPRRSTPVCTTMNRSQPSKP